jgi:hypothetical protein
VGDISKPVQMSTPTGDISKPVQMSNPVGDISKPVQMSTPTGDISKPVQMSNPVGDISKPVQTSTPTGDISKPVDLTKPTETNSLNSATVEVKDIFRYSKVLSEFYPGATYTNTELLHEHFYFSDGTNIGWEKAGLFTYDTKPSDFTIRENGFDELILKQAILKIIEDDDLYSRRYSLIGNQAIDKKIGVNMNDNRIFRDKYNCQDFVSNVLIRYRILKAGFSLEIRQNEKTIKEQFTELLNSISHQEPL